MLNAVRHGVVTAEIAGMLNAAGARPVPEPVEGEPPIITLATRNDIVSRINQRHLDALPGPVQTARADVSGDFGRARRRTPPTPSCSSRSARRSCSSATMWAVAATARAG
jgi:hypothetical protein